MVFIPDSFLVRALVEQRLQTTLTGDKKAFLDRQIDQETQEEPEHQAERWNEPRINAWRVLATYYSFIVVGANDGSYGVCVNPFEVRELD